MSRLTDPPRKALLTALSCLLIAGCSGAQNGRTVSLSSAAATSSGESEAIIMLLEQGKSGEAKKRIAAALKRDRDNPSLMVLRDSVTRNPQELLGPESYAYTTRPGDSFIGLAQRFLGNRFKFYQLSRYNGMDRPAALAAGQLLKIPGHPAVAQPQRPEWRASPAQAIAHDKPKAVASRPVPVASAPPRVANPAAAGRARSAGLAALNAGRPAEAVGLLSRAASLDPGNPTIARDLARARRINATVGSSR